MHLFGARLLPSNITPNNAGHIIGKSAALKRNWGNLTNATSSAKGSNAETFSRGFGDCYVRFFNVPTPHNWREQKCSTVEGKEETLLGKCFPISAHRPLFCGEVFLFLDVFNFFKTFCFRTKATCARKRRNIFVETFYVMFPQQCFFILQELFQKLLAANTVFSSLSIYLQSKIQEVRR